MSSAPYTKIKSFDSLVAILLLLFNCHSGSSPSPSLHHAIWPASVFFGPPLPEDQPAGTRTSPALLPQPLARDSSYNLTYSCHQSDASMSAQHSMSSSAFAHVAGIARSGATPLGRDGKGWGRGRGRGKGKGKNLRHRPADIDSPADSRAGPGATRGESPAPIPGTQAHVDSERRAWRWATLAEDLLVLATTRRFLTTREWVATARRGKTLRITQRQWLCLHSLSHRRSKGNCHGSFVLCQRCCLWWAYALRCRRRDDCGFGRRRGPAEASLIELHYMAQGVQRISEMRRHARAEPTSFQERSSESGAGTTPEVGGST